MKYTPKEVTVIEAGDFQRPPDGLRWLPEQPIPEIELSGKPAWRSNGGPFRGHPARSWPFTVEVPIPLLGHLIRVHIVGIFGLWADASSEANGTLGASVHFVDGPTTLRHQNLISGRHYSDATDLATRSFFAGDGVSVETVGALEEAGSTYRVDMLTIDAPDDGTPTHLRFKDLGSSASFAIFDVFFEFRIAAGCPFHSKSGGVSLAELSSVIRVNDRVKMSRAMDQLVAGIEKAEDLDEARGEALTFLAVVTAGMLESGGSRQLHRVQLQAARRLEGASERAEIAAIAREIVQDVARPLFAEVQTPSGHLVDRALAFVDRQFARDLSDSYVAGQLGLSTSHFRFLFKQATGQPFHKYVMALRLEKAKALLLERELPVTDVARAVGFNGLSHFSRAFAQRFSVSPSELRRIAQ